MISAALTLALALLAAPEEQAPAHPAPWFLPRSATLGLFFNSPVVTPHARLSWELGLVEQPHNDFVFTVQVGSGVGTALPEGMAELYQHLALAGLGYRSTRTVFHWGFTFTAGTLWYRASWVRGSPLRFDNRVIGYTEATARAGVKLAEHFIIGVQAGYSAPMTINRNFPANVYTGGVAVGLFLDWR